MEFDKELFDLKKQYIDYDGLIEKLIKEKEQEIKKRKIEILERQRHISYLENDIVRIRTEQQNSNSNLCHLFINPHTVYSNAIKSL